MSGDRVEVVNVVVVVAEWRDGQRGKGISAPKSFCALSDLEAEVSDLLNGATKGVTLPPRVAVAVGIERPRATPKKIILMRDCPPEDAQACAASICVAIRRKIAEPTTDPTASLGELAAETKKQYEKISAAAQPILDTLSALGASGSASPVAAVAAGVAAASAVAGTTEDTVSAAENIDTSDPGLMGEVATITKQLLANPKALIDFARSAGIKL